MRQRLRRAAAPCGNMPMRPCAHAEERSSSRDIPALASGELRGLCRARRSIDSYTVHVSTAHGEMPRASIDSAFLSETLPTMVSGCAGFNSRSVVHSATVVTWCTWFMQTYDRVAWHALRGGGASLHLRSTSPYMHVRARGFTMTLVARTDLQNIARIKHRTLPHPPEKEIATATMNHAANGATPDKLCRSTVRSRSVLLRPPSAGTRHTVHRLST